MNALKINLLVFALFCISNCVFADRYDALGGFYSIDAKTSDANPKIADIGIVKMSYHLSLSPRVSLRPGYSLYALKGKKVEFGYGLDIGVVYYFLSSDPYFYLNQGTLQWEYNEIYRPYVALSFNQRQYQSIQSSYAGLGLTIGSEFKPETILPSGLYFVGEINYLFLDGPLDSSIKEFQVIGGVGQQL